VVASKVEPTLQRARVDELDIDVDVVGDDLDEIAAGPVASSPAHILDGEAPARASDDSLLTTPTPAGVVADLEDDEEHVAHRSDLGELLASFLAHTRSEEQMTEDLRQMLGVASSETRATPALDSSDGSVTDSRH
jgi:glycerate-2-kinase